MMPSYSGIKDLYKDDNWAAKSSDDKRKELWDSFEAQPKIIYSISRDFAPYNLDLDDDYRPNQFLWRERGVTGFENDPLMRQVFVDLEYLIEEVIGAQRIREKQMKMLKGTVKKW